MIETISDVRVTLGSGGWPDLDGGAERVAAHWDKLAAANPKLWNGRVLATLAPGRPGGIAIGADRVLSATSLEGDYASFLAWRDFGFPEIGLRNLFGSALVMGTDGGLVYGVMGDGTANAGRIYPPGGSLDPGDVRADGTVDVLGSIARELREETGLDAANAVSEALFACFDGPRVSIARLFRFDGSTADIAAAVRGFLAEEADPELAGVHVLTSAADIPAGALCPGYAASLARHLLG